MATLIESLERTVIRLRTAGCVFAEREAELLHEAAAVGPPGVARDAALESLLERRISGEPLETVLGWVEFFGRRWVTARGVFVPRRRTEALAELAIARAPRSGVVVDLCSGVGVLGAVLAWRRGDVEVHCADIDPLAAPCARQNLAAAGRREANTFVHTGDLFKPLPSRLRGRVQLVLANVPYVPSGQIVHLPREAREYEPLTALDGGSDGLDVLRRLYREAAEWVCSGGVLVSEVSLDQMEGAVRAGAEVGLTVRPYPHSDLGPGPIIAQLG